MGIENNKTKAATAKYTSRGGQTDNQIDRQTEMYLNPIE